MNETLSTVGETVLQSFMLIEAAIPSGLRMPDAAPAEAGDSDGYALELQRNDPWLHSLHSKRPPCGVLADFGTTTNI